MHTLQYIATTADSDEEAHRRVKDYLETQLGSDPYSATNTWFDWFVVGGGRWASNGQPYDDSYTQDVASQDTPDFLEYLDTAKKYRREELNSYMNLAKKVDMEAVLDKIDSHFDEEFLYPHQLYPIKKIYDMTMGIWDYNSFYYDMNHESINLKYLQESLDKGDKNWYLIPVDFHY